jgi:hypothetical protein
LSGDSDVSIVLARTLIARGIAWGALKHTLSYLHY